MPQLKIDIGEGAYKNIGETSTRDGISPILINGYKNDAGSDIKRPGILEFCDLNSGSTRVDGLYYSKKQGTLYAVSNGNIYKVTMGGIATDITGDGLLKDQLVSFVEDRARVLIANGGKILYTVGVTTTAIADTDAPTNVTSLAELDTYILANVGETANVQFCNAGDYSTWDATDVFTANTRSDNVIKIVANWREMLCFGKNSIDTFYNDGATPFTKLDGAFIEQGCLSGDTVVDINNTLHWLNQDKRIVTLSGRTPTMLSVPYDKEIQSYNTVDNSFAVRISISGKDFYIITFPTEKVTLVYDTVLKQWYQWSYWNSLTAEHEHMRMNCHVYIPEWNKHLIGDRITSKIYELSEDYYDDDGDEIRFVRRTGNIAHDMMKRKRSNELIFKVKRGVGYGTAGSSAGQMSIKWRDNNGPWKNEHNLSLGASGKNENIVKLKRCGIYRNRQYEIVYTDSTPFELTNPIYEDVEELS